MSRTNKRPATIMILFTIIMYIVTYKYLSRTAKDSREGEKDSERSWEKQIDETNYPKSNKARGRSQQPANEYNVDVQFNQINVYPDNMDPQLNGGDEQLTNGQSLMEKRIKERLSLIHKKGFSSKVTKPTHSERRVNPEVVKHKDKAEESEDGARINADRRKEEEEKRKEEEEGKRKEEESESRAKDHTHISAEPGCTPVHNVYFQKITKCGASSIQNIMFRAGDKLNSSFALPGTWQIGGSKGFNKNGISKGHKTITGLYNMVAHPCLFDEAAVAEAVHPTTKYITVIRNPSERTRAMIALEGGYPDYLDRGSFKDSHDTWQHWLVTRNQLAHLGSTLLNTELQELGLNRRVINYDQDAVVKYIQTLSGRFDLVMILEQLDESLILLKELMCWDYDDVVSFKLKEMIKSSQSLKPTSDSSLSAIRDSNLPDYKLYKYFKDKLDETILNYGEDKMKREVAKLQERRQHWESKCLTGEVRAGKRSEDGPADVLYHQLRDDARTDETCLKMVLNEETFTKYLKSKQADLISKNYVYPL